MPLANGCGVAWSGAGWCGGGSLSQLWEFAFYDRLPDAGRTRRTRHREGAPAAAGPAGPRQGPGRGSRSPCAARSATVYLTFFSLANQQLQAAPPRHARHAPDVNYRNNNDTQIAFSVRFTAVPGQCQGTLVRKTRARPRRGPSSVYIRTDAVGRWEGSGFDRRNNNAIIDFKYEQRSTFDFITVLRTRKI